MYVASQLRTIRRRCGLQPPSPPTKASQFGRIKIGVPVSAPPALDARIDELNKQKNQLELEL